jgi:hypothetical protein
MNNKTIKARRTTGRNGDQVITGRAEAFIELVEAIKPIGQNGHFELLLFTRLNEIDKHFADITLGELIEAAQTATSAQTSLDGEKTPVVPQPRPVR